MGRKGDVSTSAAPTVRCPACAATLRAGSDWCTLCYADLRPTPPPAPVPAAPRTSAPAPRRARGKHARRDPAYEEPSSNPDEVEALANQMLAELAAAESKNLLGPIAGTVDTTGKRAVLMVGGAVVAMLLIFILMAVLGALL